MDRTRREFLAGIAGGSALLAGCSGSGSGGAYGGATATETATPSRTSTETPTATRTATPTGSTKTVEMVNTSFEPLRASVEPGTTVKWVNRDGYAHDVTSATFHEKAASWDFQKQVPSGGTVSHTFEMSGIYEYYCTIHGKSQMCGVVLVGDVSLDKKLPCEGGGDGYDGGGYHIDHSH